jgi:hypothetical protein
MTPDRILRDNFPMGRSDPGRPYKNGTTSFLRKQADSLRCGEEKKKKKKKIFLYM